MSSSTIILSTTAPSSPLLPAPQTPTGFRPARSQSYRAETTHPAAVVSSPATSAEVRSRVARLPSPLESSLVPAWLPAPRRFALAMGPAHLSAASNCCSNLPLLSTSTLPLNPAPSATFLLDLSTGSAGLHVPAPPESSVSASISEPVPSLKSPRPRSVGSFPERPFPLLMLHITPPRAKKYHSFHPTLVLLAVPATCIEWSPQSFPVASPTPPAPPSSMLPSTPRLSSAGPNQSPAASPRSSSQ